MAHFNATFTIEASTLEEAEALVGTWTVTPGTTLTSIMGSVMSALTPVTAPEAGTLGDAIEAAQEDRAEPEPASEPE